jgi:transposase-like protein
MSNRERFVCPGCKSTICFTTDTEDAEKLARCVVELAKETNPRWRYDIRVKFAQRFLKSLVKA